MAVVLGSADLWSVVFNPSIEAHFKAILNLVWPASSNFYSRDEKPGLAGQTFPSLTYVRN